MKKRVVTFILVIIFGFILYILIKPQKNNLNLILISVDTLSAEHIGVYGYDKNTTPNIDEFAKEAVVFNNAFTLFPITPHSFYTLMTGSNIFLKNSGSVNENLIKKEYELPFLSDILRSHGFTTAAFVTNPILGEIFPIFQKGFNKFEFSDIQSPKEQIIYEKSYKNDYYNSKEIKEGK